MVLSIGFEMGGALGLDLTDSLVCRLASSSLEDEMTWEHIYPGFSEGCISLEWSLWDPGAGSEFQASPFDMAVSRDIIRIRSVRRIICP